jgi:glycosyltransferase involved in cell wall biosynthesis
MVAEQLNPDWASVPLLAWKFYEQARDLCEVVLVTHQRNREALEKRRGGHAVEYVEESPWMARYYAVVVKATSVGGVNWPLRHALSYPLWMDFDRKVTARFEAEVGNGGFDVVHALTPMLPRYPYSISRACSRTPFLLGPVNGGVPFPQGFSEVASREFAAFNVLRLLGRLLPGYAATYRRAARILAGSVYTRDYLARTFALPPGRVELFHENGVDQAFLSAPGPNPSTDGSFRLLFVGRLVPYKGADMVLDAVAALPGSKRERVRLTIAGDGQERKALEAQASGLGISDRVSFTGWIAQEDTLGHYSNSDLFVFPSVREFGGAVVLEAMAAGVPCVVADHGGLSEYMDESCGVKIKPLSREQLVRELAEAIGGLMDDPGRLAALSAGARARAAYYSWPSKGLRLAAVYGELAGAGP